MSVYKSRRKDASAEFITDLRDLRLETMRVVRRFPTSYRWIITNKLLELAQAAYIDGLRANNIFFNQQTTREDFLKRRSFLMDARTAVDAILGEITFCYDLISQGNNFFENRAEYDRIFSQWTETGNRTYNRIKSLMEKEAERFRKYQKAKAEAKARP